MKRQQRNHYRDSTTQDIARGGMKRTTRRVERAQHRQATQRTAREHRAEREQRSN